MKSVGVFFPWKGSKCGAITIENIIKQIRKTNPARRVDAERHGLQAGLHSPSRIRAFSNDSVHWKAGASCADCHMPYTKVGAHKVSDHRVMSPLKNDMKACKQCHAERSNGCETRFSPSRTAPCLIDPLRLRDRYGGQTVRDGQQGPGRRQADRQGALCQGQGPLRGGLLPGGFHRRRELDGFPQPAGGPAHSGRCDRLRQPRRGLLRQALTKAG